MLDKVAIGRALRARRLALGLTLREAATRAGYSHASIDNVENGRQNVTIDTLQALASTLGVSLEITTSKPGPRDEIVARVARIMPLLPDEDVDVFVHELALWERRHGPK